MVPHLMFIGPYYQPAVCTFGKFNFSTCIVYDYELTIIVHHRTLFTTPVHSDDIKTVKLQGISKEIMNELISYAYMRQVTVTSYNVEELLVTADYFRIEGIAEVCCEFLRSQLNPKNCISIMQFARKYFCNKLANEAEIYLLRHFPEVAVESQEILNISLDDFKCITNHDELNVKSEETVWEAVLRWIDFDPENRKQHIVTLMQTIRLGLLETQYFLEKVKDHPYVAKSEESRPLIIETLKFLYDLEMITHRDGEVPTPLIARPRVPHEILFAIGGWSGGSPTSFIETYDTRADRWIKIDETDPVGPRAYHGTAVIGYCVYIVGGFDGMDYFNSCRRFNAVTKKWREVAPMNTRRCYVSLAVLNDIIYAMGGYDGHHRQNTAEKYDYRTNQWSLIASMHMQRSDASACTLNSKIFISRSFLSGF